jgi:peptide/nickel transport system ATP-binding protein
MSTAPLLAVDDLSVKVGGTFLLRGLSVTLGRGEALTVLGESGAGKSLMAQAVMGNLPAALSASGEISINGYQTRAADGASRRPLWGRTLALLPQEPTLALNPLRRLWPQLAEVQRLVAGANSNFAHRDAQQALERVGLRDAAEQYQWQLSGGMAQRAAMTLALAGGASIVLADEPTKGLDAVWRDHTIATLQSVLLGGGCVVVITHDLRVARALGGRLMVLREGVVVEQGDTTAVLSNPRHEFTRQLLDSDPGRWPSRAAPARGPVVVTAERLGKSFGGRALFNQLNLEIRAGDRIAIQGPSGSGKSTLGNVLLGLVAADTGRVTRANGLTATALQKLYQDPVASFAPRSSLLSALRDVAQRHGARWSDVLQRLQRLNVPESLLSRRPDQVSGGELQRVALVRILAAKPALVFADEPTSRLDPLSQKDAMAVLLDAVDEVGAALLLVTHDEDLASAVGVQRLQLAQQPTTPALMQSDALSRNLP